METTTPKNYIRISALAHFALGTRRVKAIFCQGGREKGGNYDDQVAYWMNPETYDAIPITDHTATVEDYKKHGELVEARSTDIYNVDEY